MSEKQVTVGAGIPEAMALAILSAQGDMPSLKKAETNKFAKYNFVSIDGYYEEVPKIAAKHGLFWQTHELNYEILNNGQNVAVTYGHDLFHKAGTCLPNYSRTTVIHPIQGAQTAGSALSYAEKLFMRTLFKVVTGEEDADATDNSKPSPVRPVQIQPRAAVAPKPEVTVADTGQNTEDKPGEIIGGIATGGIKVTEKDGVPIIEAPKNPEMWKMAAEVFITFIPQCSNKDELRDFWDGNAGVLDRMSKESKGDYTIVKSTFTKRKTELTDKKKDA